MSDAPGLPVTLGAREYRILPQPIGRIRRKLVKIMSLAEGEGIDGEIDSELYSVLKTFIPDLAPLYELLGYESEDAYNRGEEPSDGASDRSPTLPAIIEAVEAVYRVNGADRLVRLGKDIVGADAIRYRIRKALISSDLSASSPAPNGASDSTSSIPSEPIPLAAESGESPSPDSSTSLKPETVAA